MQGWQITVSRPDLGPDHYNSGSDGWWRQQSLKFWAVENTPCQVAIILDAKNILMRPLDNSYFWHYGSAAVFENHSFGRGIMDEFWQKAGDLLQIDPIPIRVQDTTPWVWPREQVLYALHRVQDLGVSHNRPQWQRILGLLEFQTVWLLRHDRYRWHVWHPCSEFVYRNHPGETDQERTLRLTDTQDKFNDAHTLTAFWTQHRRDLGHVEMQQLLRAQCEHWQLPVDWTVWAQLLTLLVKPVQENSSQDPQD
jgi:hypothetical protein